MAEDRKLRIVFYVDDPETKEIIVDKSQTMLKFNDDTLTGDLAQIISAGFLVVAKATAAKIGEKYGLHAHSELVRLLSDPNADPKAIMALQANMHASGELSSRR